MTNLSPYFLKKGDKAIIISPSGAIDPFYIDGTKEVLESWGLKVLIGRNAKNKYGRFGGTQDQRLSDLQLAMDNKEIKLIFCSRGGYGAIQLLDEINFNAIKANPKWILGYSDITALLFAFYQNGIASLHSPMSKHLVENSLDTSSLYLKRILFGDLPNYIVDTHVLNRSGSVEGPLLGGNLAVMSGLIGTDFFKIPEGTILFIEDIAEAPYKIDRMLWQLKLSGVLAKLGGLIVGKFTSCEEDSSMKKNIYELIYDIVKSYTYPIAFNFPVGHVNENYPLIHGQKARLKVSKNKINLDYIF